MKSLVFACAIMVSACTGIGSGDCLGDSCLCPAATSCDHACEPGGAPCHVQSQPGQACDVTCEPTEECHVEASQSAQVAVDCAGTAECHVTCPSSGCTVTNCIGADCNVTCGLTGVATHTGSTASCP